MLIKIRKRWEIPEREAVPEEVYLNRRALMRGATGAGVAAVALPARAQRVGDDPSMTLYPFPRNNKYTLDRPVTDEKHAANYNNFIEFSSARSGVTRAAQSLKTRPWTVTIDGLVEKPIEIDIDSLLKAMPREERLYRMRCVETWAVAVPWSGFAFKALMDMARPLASAKYVRLESFLDKQMAPGQRSPTYPFPYVEGMTMAEAENELAFLVTGAYGKPAANPFGAPLRLVLPWKYGFKSIKSIRKISFVEKRPISLWEQLQPDEYGFWANVNPEVNHVRWSQKDEQLIGSPVETRPTQLFNGYAAEVAHLYKGLEKERLFR